MAGLAVTLGATTYALLLDPVTYEPAGWFRYLTAFAVAGGCHYLLTRLVLTRAGGWGGYR